uniref:Uncharacterized protein n=1 Tax=Phenylobacterium glaciei TaxID=2803784 RepID=A0A974P1V5_9CAUL|nr:hypothetical protein JKL49_20915 [Phenylobacterium glaciei]
MILGMITLSSTRAALTAQFDARIASEAAALAEEYQTEGLNGVVQAVRNVTHPGALDYGLKGPNGVAMVGRLAANAAPIGWSTASVRHRGGESETIRVLTIALPGATA